jgi:thioredoxin-like negative regulator of GroEL
MSADASSPAPLLVAGLCAQWCGTCRDWRPVFDEQSRSFAGRADFACVDVEDHDEVMGHVDVENFPTLMIARGDDVLFFGTITPHAQTLARLVQSAVNGDLKPVHNAEIAGLPQRVREAL